MRVDLPAAFARHLRTSRLLGPEDRVVVACSGGADSVALLRLLAALRGTAVADVAVAHLDHALRPDSADDAAFVARLAASLGLRSVVERRRVRPRPRESPEEAARRIRYAFLADAARALGGTVVATAHHLDDQAETVLYRVLRGTGIDGLRGILPVADLAGVRVVRPFLPFRRDALRRWLAGEGAGWREDPTNAAGNDRAVLRNEVLPLVRRLLRRDPAAPLARLAELAAAEPPLPRSPSPRPPAPEEPRAAHPLRVTWERRAADVATFLERLRAAPGAVELLDAHRVSGRLRLRRSRPGDRFHALGLPKPQRLGHYLQRRGVPAAARAAVRVLCDDEGIVCVPGHGICARVALHDGSTHAIVVRAAGRPSEVRTPPTRQAAPKPISGDR